jgi:hypothetical protein
MFHQGIISFPSSEEPEKQRGGAGLGAFGEAGDMLSLYANQMDYHVQRQRQTELETNGPGAKVVPVVAIEVDKDGVTSRETVA